MQRLLASAIWDADLVRDDVRVYVVETIGTPGGIIVIDAHELSEARQKISGRSNSALRDDWRT